MVVHAVSTWRCYLEGVEFTMVTDCNSVVYLQTQPNLSRRQVRWSDHLLPFRFRWQYRPGRISVADPLKRVQAVKLATISRGQSQAVQQPVPGHAADPSPTLP